MHTKARFVAYLFSIVMVFLDVGAADGMASVTAAFSPGSTAVTLPKIETSHRLYLRASAQQSVLIKVLRMAGLAHSIGQFQIPGTLNPESDMPLIPLTDAAGRPIVLGANGTSFGANVSYSMDVRPGSLPNLTELVAVPTEDAPSPAYVAWVEPSPSSLGVSPGTSIVMELARGESFLTTSTFRLDDRTPFPGPISSPTSDNGRRLEYRPPQELSAGRHSVQVNFGSFGRSEQFSWAFDVGPGPALFIETGSAGSPVVNFVGRLESAPLPGGPFLEVPGATSPYRISTGDGISHYFRVVP